MVYVTILYYGRLAQLVSKVWLGNQTPGLLFRQGAAPGRHKNTARLLRKTCEVALE